MVSHDEQYRALQRFWDSPDEPMPPELVEAWDELCTPPDEVELGTETTDDLSNDAAVRRAK